MGLAEGFQVGQAAGGRWGGVANTLPLLIQQLFANQAEQRKFGQERQLQQEKYGYETGLQELKGRQEAGGKSLEGMVKIAQLGKMREEEARRSRGLFGKMAGQPTAGKFETDIETEMIKKGQAPFWARMGGLGGAGAGALLGATVGGPPAMLPGTLLGPLAQGLWRKAHQVPPSDVQARITAETGIPETSTLMQAYGLTGGGMPTGPKDEYGLAVGQTYNGYKYIGGNKWQKIQ